MSTLGLRRARGAGILSNPVGYAAWTVTVIAVLVGSYLGDPYVFGLATLVLAWASAGVAICGLIVTVVARTLSPTERVVIVTSVTLAAAAVAIALVVLRGFSWS
jgi:hypothetical protein